jgi:uncharacterized protein (DUF2147 family)
MGDVTFMRVARAVPTSVVLVALFAIGDGHAAEPTGTWLTKDRDARVTIAPCGQALCGRVVWLKDGVPTTDKFNQDPARRSRPLMGLEILSNMKRAGTEAKWSGQLYHPESGKTYRSNMKLISPNSLVVEGCVSFYCQPETWTRAN